MHFKWLIVQLLLSLFILSTLNAQNDEVAMKKKSSETYQDLLTLFQDWRDFENPQLHNGAPDYRAATMAKMHEELKNYQARLTAIDTSGWTIPEMVDFQIVRAEMNGMDFNIRVLKPWVRDPAYYTSVWDYQSDTPAHEGPTNHALIELWTYTFPLDKPSEAKLTAELKTVPPLLEQARENLTGNGRELWIGGIGNLRDQASMLEGLKEQTATTGSAFKEALEKAHKATLSFVEWLEAESPKKTGPSGIGKENYTWHRHNVHLVPLSWEQEVDLLKRELSRAHSSMKLEEQRNIHLPPLEDIDNAEDFAKQIDASLKKYLAFLGEKKMLVMRDYMDSALRVKQVPFIPKDKRNFFLTAIHYEPNTLNTHFYHWWDLQRMEKLPHPSPIRRGPLLYNIWDSRSEGLATGVEEMFMHAGLYDDNPQVREIVWIMLAQRAARGLGSLYAHANIFTMKEARDYHVKWTPRGWMREDLDLLGFEQLLYMRQPGYGSIYVTGKYLIEELLTERSNQLKDKFVMADFFEEMDAIGLIPVSLIRWEMTGNDDQIRELTGKP